MRLIDADILTEGIKSISVTFDARPVTTVWMRGRNKDGQDGIYCCECEYFVPLFYDYYYDVNDLKNDYMYCPHCGRKTELRGENDNEGV